MPCLPFEMEGAMQTMSVAEQSRLVGGDFDFGLFVRGAACGLGMAAGVATAVGTVAAIAACLTLLPGELT
ncbi:MAG TPA: hypothetical protein DGD08_18355 [Gemmatimonas aurantiaca]|uniref:Uncharacterized protein n=2 Tax=Gemmatimonas aurantiaca TaxID=173480 RepID=C1AE09_GEMAT|nr:hypothetical protein [Gemmatimonas aurantiaca]BAH40736.1 hypothetical protein GAU_3694 [Gemmatimonas aurantiaca T-27]HCT59167.1 hypothetical protein [Gemmatimonas aurantiaca]